MKKIDLYRKTCKKSMKMTYTLTGDDNSPVMPGMVIRCHTNKCIKVLSFKNYTDSFTDIEFNPKKSINCQAIATAIFVGLTRNGLLEKALESPESFKTVVYGKPQIEPVQLSLFD